MAVRGIDGQVTGQAPGHLLAIKIEAVGHLKAAGIEPGGCQHDPQFITHHQGAAVIGAAMHDRQGHLWLVLGAGK